MIRIFDSFIDTNKVEHINHCLCCELGGLRVALDLSVKRHHAMRAVFTTRLFKELIDGVLGNIEPGQTKPMLPPW
jgi:hypothetical protein